MTQKTKKKSKKKTRLWGYDAITFFWHRILKKPIRFKICEDIQGSKQPKATVVFLHGIAATSSTWRKTLRNFSKDKSLKDFRLISVDLLGFGKALKADWLNYDFEDYCAALNNTLKKLKKPIILVGHSMGSLIAAKYAELYPNKVEQLILVSPPIFLPKELAQLPDKFYMKSYRSLNDWSKHVGVKALGDFVEKVSSFRSRYLGSKAFRDSMENIVLNRSNYQLYKGLKIPTTIIHGRFDPLVIGGNLEKLAKENNQHIKLVKVVSHHDICSRKQARIKEILINYLAEEKKQ